MMKRILACLVAIVCLLTAVATVAVAENLGTMKVIKVKQAVNLRQGPSTDTPSLGLVPLGTALENCQSVEGSEWIKVNYGGTEGYIRGDFLQAEGGQAAATPAAETAQPAAEPAAEAVSPYIFDTVVNGTRIYAELTYEGEGEYLNVRCEDAKGHRIWSKHTRTSAITELVQTDAFIAGTPDKPLVMMYNAESGLTARDPATGEKLWKLERDQIDLGASISHAVSNSGIMYIGGYYGPDPVAIDANGNVLWTANSGSDDIFWLTGMELRSDGIVCTYGSMGESSGYVVYGYNGLVQDIVYE